VYPNSVHVNRGNHEEQIMNMRYGFIKEVINKYHQAADVIIKGFQSVFRSLPLATVVDRRVFVVHAGISDKVTLDTLNAVPRQDYVSVLRPPYDITDEKLLEWKLLLDVLWSDPRAQAGCEPNEFRGGGVYWGPDVTTAFLEATGFSYIIRSHECKPDGHDVTHQGRVHTIFSASNYYGPDSNRGAYIVLEKSADYRPRPIEFLVSSKNKTDVSFRDRVVALEKDAIKQIQTVLAENADELMAAFRERDTGDTGLLPAKVWADVIKGIVPAKLPWLSLRKALVESSKGGMVRYASSVDGIKIEIGANKAAAPLSLYKNRTQLETLFRIMDKDNSGDLSMEEFKNGVRMLNKYTKKAISDEEIEKLARDLDMDGNGKLSFVELLEMNRRSALEG